MSFIVKLMTEHASAPRWRDAPADALTPAMMVDIRGYEERLAAGERDVMVASLTQRQAVETALRRSRSTSLHRRTQADAPRDPGFDDVARMPTTSREMLAANPAALVPDTEDLGPLVVVQTSGTATGRPLVVPHHPAALAMYAPLIRATLRRRGIAAELGPDLVGVVRIETEGGSFACTLPALESCGFAQLDLGPGAWRDPLDAARFVAAFAPAVLIGTPASLEALSARVEGAGAKLRPRAILSAGAELSYAARDRLERILGGPVIDWYATTETGPVAYSCRSGRMHILPHDLLVESLGDGQELAFSGGRNPYLPLVRYLPGDRGQLEAGPCACGDPSPRITGLRRAR